MADLAIGITRSVVEGTLRKVQSAIEEESKLRQDTQRDLAFITGELQMMQSFLGDVDKERAKNIVVKACVGQVRDLAYAVEDCIELVARIDNKPDWWRRLLPGCMAGVLPLDKAMAEIKQLKPRTVDVSRRFTQYGLTGNNDLGSRSIIYQQQVPPDAVSATELNILAEARDSTKLQGGGDLAQLIIKKNDDLVMISVWGAGSHLGTTSIIRKFYLDQEICEKFGSRGWIRLTYPFNPHKFLQSLVTQFYSNSCLQQGTTIDVALLTRMMETTSAQELMDELMNQLCENRYLIVLENVCTMGEWDVIRACLPDRKKGCVILSTEQRETAIMCIGHSYQVLELQLYSPGHPVYAFFKEYSRPSKEIVRVMSSNNEILEEFSELRHKPRVNEVGIYLTRTCISGWHVMSVWGIPGVGKSVLTRNVYYEIMHGRREDIGFEKFSWVDVSHPFNLRNFTRSLLSDFHSVSIEALVVQDPIQECHKLLEKHRCLVVIDGIKSTEEWDLLQPAVSRHSNSVIIVITTEEIIATYCADSEDVVLNIRGLDVEASFDLFKKQVQRMTRPASPDKDSHFWLSRMTDLYSMELKELILKCGGLPKVVASVAGYLAPKTMTFMESTSILNHTFMRSLQCNPEFAGVRGIFHWLDGYIGTWPDFLKQCTLYLSVFSRSQLIRRRRLLRRWIAEGYIEDSQTVSAEESGERSFARLLGSCITEPPPDSIYDTRTVLFQINRFVGQYILSRPTEENLFLELEGWCAGATQRIVRHLSIRQNWVRDKIVFESIDFSRLRSLTVSGRWKSFFISESMKLLRVLDLEDSSGVTDKDLENIVNLLSWLKFLSVRGCREIRRLPRRLGDLRQLETLDVRGTSVITIPGTTVKLKKLQYMRAGTTIQTMELFTQRASVLGVNLPEGIENLTLLTTLGVIDISAEAGKAIKKVLNKLTRLCKLEVSGVNKKNSKDFWAAISCHIRLESLSVWLSEERDCLYDTTSLLEHPPNLRSLKIHGLLEEVPEWIRNLRKLTKLQLEITIPGQANINYVLAEIKQLSILRLCVKPLEDHGELEIDFFLYGTRQRSYSMLKVLDITSTSMLHIRFGTLSMGNLELLIARCCSGSEVRCSGLDRLSVYRLKEVRLIGSNHSAFKEDMEEQLMEHPRKPLLKLRTDN